MLKTRSLCLLTLHAQNGLLTSQASGSTVYASKRQQTSAALKDELSESVESAATAEWRAARPFSEIPREGLLPMLRKTLPGGKYYQMDITKMTLAMREDCGEIFILPSLLGRPPILTTHNPKDFEKVFRNEGIWPDRPGSDTMRYHREKHRRDFFQGIEGLITTQEKSWGKFRSTVNPVLMQPKNVKLYLKKMSQVNKEFLECIREMRDPQTLEVPDNFEDYINRWTLESISVVALDKQLGLLKSNAAHPEAARLFKGLNDFFELCADLEFKTSLWRYVATPRFKRLMAAYDSIQEVTLGFVNEAISRLQEEAKQGVVRAESEQSVLEKLLKIDKKVATVMAMDMLMAGVDTTSSTFAGIMLCLAKNPEKQQRLREEICRILPQKDSDFTEESLKNAPYLRACIKESLRIYPLVIGNARVTQTDCVLSGYQVPKGTFVSMIPLTLLKNDEYFARGQEYLPERWLRADSSRDQQEVASGKCPVNDLKAKNPFVYLPFGFGPRMCIGKRIVDMELELGVARIIRNFKVEFNYPTENAFKALLINMPNIPLKFKFVDIAA